MSDNIKEIMEINEILKNKVIDMNKDMERIIKELNEVDEKHNIDELDILVDKILENALNIGNCHRDKNIDDNDTYENEEYEVYVMCYNCMYRDRISLPKGKRVSDKKCPNCGCKELKTTRTKNNR